MTGFSLLSCFISSAGIISMTGMRYLAEARCSNCFGDKTYWNLLEFLNNDTMRTGYVYEVCSLVLILGFIIILKHKLRLPTKRCVEVES